jgi:hypothetical protein
VPAADRIDGFEALTRLTRRSVHFTYVVFLMRLEDKATSAAAVAKKFSECSEHLAAMRIHFSGWSDRFTEADEAKGLS